MKIQNIIEGEVVQDPMKLQEVLGLTMNENVMINTQYPFKGTPAENTEHAGYQLVMAMMSVKMSRIDRVTLTDFIQRLGYVDACGKSAVPLPRGVNDLVDLYGKMKAWVDKGWELETDLTHIESPAFNEWVEFKVTRDVIREIQEVRDSIRKQLIEKLPEAAAKELSDE